MMTQTNCSKATAMGASLVSEMGIAGGGATFRAWAPRAQAVYVNGVFGGVPRTGQGDDLLLVKDGNGYWSGFLADAGEGDAYRFYVVGAGSSGYKRDPYARELANDATAPFPVCAAVVRRASAYAWHDAGFRTPEYADMVVYQLHIGTYAPAGAGWASTYLDVVMKVEYLAALGVNMVQPLPVYEMEDSPSQGYPGLGYQGADLYSPAFDYVVYHADGLEMYLATINRLLAAKGFTPMTVTDITAGNAQLKVMVDLLHVYGIGVMFDVVYNHAGGWSATYNTPAGPIHGDDDSLYFWDRMPGGDNNQSLYFSDKGFVGGLAFALWNQDVRGFLWNNAAFHVAELHADGFRYDEISMLLSMNEANGWEFCRELSTLVRSMKPRVLQNAEYWPGEYRVPAKEAVAPAAAGGMGFDTVQHDGLREAIRSAVQQAAGGAGPSVAMSAIAMALFPGDGGANGFRYSWQTVPCVENHDIVKLGEKLRIPALADGSNARSWYARSRTRVAMALLLTAPGIPQLFMGQEFLEDKQWCPDPRSPDHLIWWAGLGTDSAMQDHLRFTQDAVALRTRLPGLRGEGLNVFYTSDADRVIAYHRWVPGIGDDVVVVATFSESTWWAYELGFPSAGRWVEVFNSDVYDGWVNPMCAGNAGGVEAKGSGMHGLAASASVVAPANGLVVFVKERG
jgi:1,4-alpha-glucan branching enzyme